MICMIFGAEIHPDEVAVTLRVAVCKVVPLLMALKLFMLPVPDAASPMEVLLFVQLMTALVGLAEKVILPVGCVVHTTTLFEGIINAGGLGSVNVIGPIILEVQPLSVTEILSYSPAVSVLMTMAPAEVDVLDRGVMGTPFFE
jgi:hypothetical protein